MHFRCDHFAESFQIGYWNKVTPTGDPEFRDLIKLYYGKLYRAACFLSGDAWAAEDIVQDTFLAARMSWHSFRGDSTAYTWLYRIMLNTFRKKLRRQKKFLSLEQFETRSDESGAHLPLASDAPQPSETAERSEEAALVRKAINSLPPHHREVLVLRYLEEKSYEEVAKTMECSVGTVKSRLHYALKRIGEILRAELGPEETGRNEDEDLKHTQ